MDNRCIRVTIQPNQQSLENKRINNENCHCVLVVTFYLKLFIILLKMFLLVLNVYVVCYRVVIH
jgi:hypothetical protein